MSFTVNIDSINYILNEDLTAIVSGYIKTNLCPNLVIPEVINYNKISYFVKSIMVNAFYECSIINSVIIGNSVVSIEDGAFYDCKNLTIVNIPASVNYIGIAAFASCTKLKSINVDKKNNSFSNDKYGVLYDKHKTRIIQVPLDNFNLYDYPNTFFVPHSVSEICDGAFFNCTNLISLFIPNNLKYIGACAFQDCTNLTDIFIDLNTSSLTIDAEAFVNIAPNNTIHYVKGYNTENIHDIFANYDPPLI